MFLNYKLAIFHQKEATLLSGDAKTEQIRMAKACCEEAIRICRIILGPNHP